MRGMTSIVINYTLTLDISIHISLFGDDLIVSDKCRAHYNFNPHPPVRGMTKH